MKKAISEERKDLLYETLSKAINIINTKTGIEKSVETHIISRNLFDEFKDLTSNHGKEMSIYKPPTCGKSEIPTLKDFDGADKLVMYMADLKMRFDK